MVGSGFDEQHDPRAFPRRAVRCHRPGIAGARATSREDDSFRDDSLAIAGHVFLMFLAPQTTLSIPPWPLFGVLALLDPKLFLAIVLNPARVPL